MSALIIARRAWHSLTPVTVGANIEPFILSLSTMAIQYQLEYPTPVAVELDPRRTILVVIDMCNETCNPSGFRYGGERVSRIVQPIAELRRRVRAAGGQVIHTQSVRKRDALEFKMGNRVRLLEGTWGVEFIEELQPAPDEPVVVKYSHDCFNQTNLEALLERMGARPGHSQIVVTGHAARGCVQCAVVGFSVRDYWVYAPLDCIGQKEEEQILLAFDLFTTWGYSHNTHVTRSDLMSFTAQTTDAQGRAAYPA